MKILIVGPSWVGDMVMAQSLFMVLHQQHDGLQLDVLAPDWTRPLLERIPEVNEALTMPLGHGNLGLGERRRLGLSLRDRGYNQAIVLPNSLKSALVPFFAKISLRTGWRGEMRYGLLNDCRRLDKKRYSLMVQRFVALAWPSGTGSLPECPAPALSVDADRVAALLARRQLTTDKPIVVLCPGAEFGPSKQWPPEYFAELATQLHQQGKQVWVVGSENDKPTADIIVAAARAGHAVNLAGTTSLAEVIDLMSLAEAVVSNDSGLMHIAAALGRPLVAVYGSTSPSFTPPLGSDSKIIQSALACSPCFERECPLKHHDCMRQTKPVQVKQALFNLLEGSGSDTLPADSTDNR